MQRIYVLLIFLLLSLSLKAQNLAVDYLFNRTSEPYVPLTNDTTLGSGFQDDILYMSQTLNSGPTLCTSCSLTGQGLPIGFPFLFDGNTFTRWAFSSNGYIKLGNGTFTITNSLASAFSSAFDSTNQNNLISALHGDIMMTEIQGSFRYRTIGNPGSRILVVEYRAMKHYVPNVTSEEIYNFQIRLHEGSNKISFAYGPFLKDDISRNYTVGIRGRFFNDIHLRSLPSSAPNWLANTRGTNSSATMATNTELTPIDGLVFNFIPRQYDNDLTLEEVLTPLKGIRSCPLTNTEQVVVRVKNTGVLLQNAATVGYRVGNGTVVSQPVTFSPPLSANQSRDITFTLPANMSGTTPPELTTFVYIANEEEGSRNNDTVVTKFSVGRPFEVHAISSYDSLKLAGWNRGRGAVSPTGDYSLWKATNSFSLNNSSLEMRTDTPLVKNEWFYSPGYRVDTSYNYGINFSSAITDGLTGTNSISSIGDDTVYFAYSTDCRQTWKTLKKFSSADLTAGVIDNTLKPFEVFLPPSVKELVTFGFVGKNNGNAFPNAYRFHFSNFYLRRVPRFDLSADTVRIPSVVSLSCKYSAQEPLYIKITNRGFDNVDSTDAGFSINGGLVIKKKFGFNPALPPGGTATLYFEGSSGADLSVQEGSIVTGFVALRKENVAQKTNDTTRRNYNLIPGLTIPTPVYPTYAAALGARWQRGRGVNAPAGVISSWGNKTTFPAQQTTGIDLAGTSSTVNDWFYSASYVGPSIVTLVFKAAVTATGSTNAATTMNSDSVKAMYSVDCGASWKSVKSFSSADLTSGNINNALKEFSFQIFNTRGSILVGFAAFRDGSSPVTAGYTFHVDSISVGTPSFPDFAAVGLLPGLEGTITCPGNNPVSLGVIVRNAGSVPITSATVGYRLNGVVTSKVVNFDGAGLAVGGSDTIKFAGTEAPVYAAPGNYFLKGFVQLGSEAATTAFNDSSNSNTFTLFGLVPVPYNQTFTGPGFLPIGWISDTASGKGFKHTLGRGPAGTQALSFRAQPTAQRASLITRNFGTVSTSTPFLNLTYRSQEQSLAFFRLRPSDFIDVYVSTDCGSTYTILGRIDSLNQQVAAGFLPRDFPLDLYIGQNITVKLDAKLTPKAFSSVFLDISRFSIGLQVGNEELISGNNASVVLYPNPTSAQRGLSFHSSDLIRSATAYSVDGKRVLLPLQQGDSDKYEVETNRLSPGIYTLILDGQSAPVRLRFVVE